MSESERYIVEIYTKRLPGGFHGPRPLRRLLSTLSESVCGSVGSSLRGMSKEEAERIANEETTDLYVDGAGKLRSSKAVLVNVRDILPIDRFGI